MKQASGWEGNVIGVERFRDGWSRPGFWLSYDPHHLAGIGCLGRLVIAGWAVEVYRPAQGTTLGTLAERIRKAAERFQLSFG